MMRNLTSYLRMSNNRGYPDLFPVEVLKRVNCPTTLIIDDKVQRVDERESGFNRTFQGDFASYLRKERPRFVVKQTLSAALEQR